MPYKIITKFVALSESFKFPLLGTALVMINVNNALDKDMQI